MQDAFDRLDRAIHATVHEYQDERTRHRGAVALAPRVGMQAGTLSNKANPTIETHQLGLRESIPLQIAAGDYRILHEYALALGHIAYRLPSSTKPVSDLALLDDYTAFHAAVGRKATAIRNALADGRIERAEVDDIRGEFEAAICAGLELLARLEVLARG
jgi:hypothetical protein